MIYTMRDKKGIMIARFSKDVASKIFMCCDGFWRPYKIEDETMRCFELNADQVFGMKGQFKIYFWEGSKIIEEKD